MGEERELWNISGVPWLVNESIARAGDLRLLGAWRKDWRPISAAEGTKLKKIYFLQILIKISDKFCVLCNGISQCRAHLKVSVNYRRKDVLVPAQMKKNWKGRAAPGFSVKVGRLKNTFAYTVQRYQIPNFCLTSFPGGRSKSSGSSEYFFSSSARHSLVRSCRIRIWPTSLRILLCGIRCLYIGERALATCGHTTQSVE
jgi:hypothetical protein